MKQKSKNNFIWLPFAISISIVFGIIIGTRFAGQKTIIDYDRKINTLLNLIADDYVDTLSIGGLVEKTIPELLKNLDPHTTYFSAEDLKKANEDLNGSFSGIGISFMMINDTVNVIEVIPGGPSEKAGILAGDRIVSINGKNYSTEKLKDEDIKAKLRGENGSIVKLGIKRSNTNKTLTFNVKRGEIPVKSVDVAYMIDKTTGYIKVNKFGRTTYDEFITGLGQLKGDGAKRYIVDLRGNGGGFMEMAILMANEFLPENELIVYTKGRDKKSDSQVWSDGNGSFKDAELVVLIDEFSASSSEIFAGAIQDNDRGLIMGCRSFGKGLVQKEFMLRDSSAVRMTIARYYTPTGRCIQKDYTQSSHYDNELYERYTSGELYSRDSIKEDKSKVFVTRHNRKLYGGGGIVPDIFIPRDTTGITSYYVNIVNAGLLQKFAYQYVDLNRAELSKLKDYKQFLRVLPSNDNFLYDFVTFASQNGVPARWYYISQSKNLILTQLKALIARDIFGSEAYYPIYNRTDKTIEAALKALNKHRAVFPLTAEFE